ncbi:hypothetical protein [Streptomyces sp. EN16]|uniref:hypothetical protein n=1 Tax=Streptomyces sp. EN16 TaxID=212773 RepID=UPI000851D606|nr:hypothetical protein [Streptomyces sp. EN16]
MPTADGYNQKIQYPVLSDAPNIELAFQTVVNGLVAQSVLKFANANERSATLVGSFSPVPGMITYLIAEDRWEAYRANGKWLLMSDGPWTPLTMANSHQPNSGSPGWRRKAGGGIELRGRIQPLPGNNLWDNGTLVNFANLPSIAAPASLRNFIVASNRINTSATVSHYTCRVEIRATGTMWYDCEAGGGLTIGATQAWFTLDGIQFSAADD